MLKLALTSVTALALAATPTLPAAAQAATHAQPHDASVADAAVTNLGHLDFLLDDVPLLAGVSGHTTYRLKQEPTAEAPWVYADRQSDGSYRPVGGGTFDPETGYYGQGAFDADDIARAAVVYVRDWQQNHTASSRQHAYELLRELTYLQTASGPNAGDVVLWQQADGTLNASPTPADSPDPSDAGESFWLARTIWALGEALPAFERSDASFAWFLEQRYDLAVAALNRGSLARYGQWDVSNGARVPAWIVTQSTAATSEAVLGLSAALRADPRDSLTRSALAKEADGLAAMAAGRPGVWPFGGFLATTTSRSMWNGWGGEAPEALSAAAAALGRPDYQRIAESAVRNFIPQVLTTGGPDNGWTPTPFDQTQIAYGADALVQSIVTVAARSHDESLQTLAGMAAAWYFGANRSGQPLYDPTTGTCVDGVAGDGTINRNCGAESTIHTQLTMLTLDAHPRIRAVATRATNVISRSGLSVAEAESGTLSGAGSVQTPTSAWTGSANWSSSYVEASTGASVTIPLASGITASKVYPIVDVASASSGSTYWTATLRSGHVVSLGTTGNGGLGAQGIAPTPDALLPLSLPTAVPADAVSVTARVVSGSVKIDALLLQPEVSQLSLGGPMSVVLRAFAKGGFSVVRR
ncbi:hypothetical protein [Gryllotalpicola ginsengisoli]|uniref:hypothetical protein n=1 Tax=Gryllotalpicola ginsengisoli TaxID=444608 RepID=UPI0003B38DCC|nr:hypothetical protein [Gryllotalpicola ginsengisoli]